MVAGLPWVLPILKRLELPGVTMEFDHQIADVKKKSEEAGITPVSEHNDAPTDRFDYQYLVDSDPNLALAALRLDLESKLRTIVPDALNPRHRGIRPMLHTLVQCGRLTREQEAVILQLTSLLNEAVHGELVERYSLHQAIDIGRGILQVLDTISKEQTQE